MKNKKTLFIGLIAQALLFFSVSGPRAQTFDINALERLDTCPVPNLTHEKFGFKSDEEEFIDYDRSLKDLSTDIVNDQFFATPHQLFSFMKVVYEGINKAVSAYGKEKGLLPNAALFIFKGGNVLRLFFNEFLSLMPYEARQILRDFYQDYFKRSDADFSVFVDEKKLGDLDYDEVLRELTDVVFLELGELRKIFKAEPEKYFGFLRLKNSFASKELKKYFNELQQLEITEDETNPVWHGSEFVQLQFQDVTAGAKGKCPYVGQIDYVFRFADNDKNKIVGIPVSKKPDWIVNTENRALQFPSGDNPNKTVKFFLDRAKIYFNFTFIDPNGNLQSKPIGGELIDVSFPHRYDSFLRKFLDNVNHLVTDYKLVNEKTGEAIKMKAYSLAGLIEDLEKVLFVIFDRPWHGGPKYQKRLNRAFLLAHVEMAATYGLGVREIRDLLSSLETLFIPSFKSLLKDDNLIEEKAQLLSQVAGALADKNLPETSNLIKLLANFANKLANEERSPDDPEEYLKFVDIVIANINIAKKLANMTKYPPIKLEDIYNANFNSLF